MKPAKDFFEEYLKMLSDIGTIGIRLKLAWISESRVAAAKMSPDSFVNKILSEKLKEHGFNFKEFTALKVKPDYMLNDKEITIMQDILNSAPLPDKNTTFIKNLPVNDIQKYLNGDYTSIKGFVAKVEDSSHIHNYAHVRESLRLDYS